MSRDRHREWTSLTTEAKGHTEYEMPGHITRQREVRTLQSLTTFFLCLTFLIRPAFRGRDEAQLLGPGKGQLYGQARHTVSG
jgi:hypothetical protein